MRRKRRRRHFDPSRFERALRGRPDLAVTLLTGHLLIEEWVYEAACRSVASPEALNDAGLSFSQLVDVARAVSEDRDLDPVWKVCKRLNALRNEVAHSADATFGVAAALRFHSFAQPLLHLHPLGANPNGRNALLQVLTVAALRLAERNGPTMESGSS